MSKITDDADNYYVEFEIDGWTYATVVIKKPCPLRELIPRAERELSLPLIYHRSPPSTKELKR